jgi:hypothetical protein
MAIKRDPRFTKTDSLEPSNKPSLSNPKDACPDVIERFSAKTSLVLPVQISAASPTISFAAKTSKSAKFANPLHLLAHSTPKFEAVLGSPLQKQFERSNIGAGKERGLGPCTMNEMLHSWTSNIRAANFQKANLPLDPEESPSESKEHVPGIISGTATRDSSIRKDQSPGPSDSTVKKSPRMPKTAGFAWQSSRPESPPNDQVLSDVGEHIDKVLSRCPQAIPFAKQSAREGQKKSERTVWSDIEKEQEEIFLSKGAGEAGDLPGKRETAAVCNAGRPS